MSAYADALRHHVEQHPHWISPEARHNELRQVLRRPIPDLCISRPTSRLAWGVPFPHSLAEGFVTYVWFDALLHYLSAADGHWPADLHLVGKDILTTHTVYWGAMLLALGLPLPAHISAHGWWTVRGQKMSKSLGNTLDPRDIVREFGSDGARYLLVASKSVAADGDFSVDDARTRYNADLADLGYTPPRP